MTVDDRARSVVRKWAENVGPRSWRETLADLTTSIAEEIETAVDDEVEACAATLEQHLRRHAYPQNGLPGALRRRRRCQ